MIIWERPVLLAALLGASLLTSLGADAEKIKVVSGMIGAQESKSKELLALSPAATDQIARSDLLSVLQPTVKFVIDNSRNVEGATFYTQPYQTDYRYVCREDRVTLGYQLGSRFDAAGKWLDFYPQPAGVEAQAVYHIERLPVPGPVPGTSYMATICDARHPGAGVSWFAAPKDSDAVRAANMFRMAEDNVKSGRLTPGFCDPHGAETCRQWILSLDDPSKIESVAPCASSTSDDACYVISFDSVDVTITGKIPSTAWENFTPTIVTSIRVDTVATLME